MNYGDGPFGNDLYDKDPYRNDPWYEGPATDPNLHDLDDTERKRRPNHDDMQSRRDAFAAKNGIFDREETPRPRTMQSTTPSRRSTNLFPNRIASIKRGGKARSASPLTGPSTTFTPPNTFTTTPSNFSFGAQQPQQSQPTPGFGGGSESFTFGQQQPSEGNGMDRIEQAPASGTAPSFAFGQNQQQQLNFNGFGQQSTNNPFTGFGQQNAAPTGAAQTPSFSFGQQTQNNSSGSAPSNPFGGFGQQTQTTANTSTSFTFGAQSQSSSPAPTANPFSGFNSQPQPNGTSTPSNSFTFGAQPSKNQAGANGSTTPNFGGFGASQPAQQPAQQNTNSLFAPKPSTEQKSPSPFQGGAFLFSKPAETPKADGWSSFKSASPAATNGGDAAGSSVLSGWQKEQTSKPAFSFSQSQMPTGDVDDDDAMTSPQKSAPAQPAASAFGGTSSLFGTPQPSSTAGNDLFSRISKPAESNTSNAAESTDNGATPKASASGGDLFSRMTFPDKAQNQGVSATPAPKGSNPFAGFSVAPPATAPAKNLFAGANSAPDVPATPTPAADKEPEAPATVKPAQPFSTSSLFSAGTSNTPAGSSLFAPKPAVEKAPETPAAATPAPSFTNSLFSPSNAKAPATSLFTPAPSQQTTSTATNVSSQAAPAPVAVSSSNDFDAENASKLCKLNEGLKERLSKADPNEDFSQLFKFYIQKVKAINAESGQNGQKSASMLAAQTPKPAAYNNLFDRAPSGAIQSAKRGTDSIDDSVNNKRRKSGNTNGVDLTKSLFAPRPTDAQTPKPAFTNSLFGRVPATEPRQGAAKRSIEDDDSVPATEKRRKSKDTVDYPKLPAGASDTAKLFEAALDKPADSGAAAKSLFTPKPTSEAKAVEDTPKTSTFGGFQPSTSSLFSPAKTGPGGTQAFGNGVSASNSLFATRPSADADKTEPAATGGFKPAAAGGFKPAAPAAGSSNFLSSFGQNASKEQDAALKKAMDEDFDSEDDDPVEWKKQYEEKQAAKRKAIEDAAKSGGGFSFKGGASTPAAKSGSGFTFNGGASTPAAKEPEKKDSEPKDTAPEDNTWKQGTPIKFGVEASTPVAPLTAPPKGSGLFGSTGGASLFANAGSKTPQPSSGLSLFSQTQKTQSNGASLFSFSKTTETSTADSSTTKPAEPAQSNTEAATNGEAGEGDEETANEPQVEDMTALQPAEQEESDVLYYIEKAKSHKFETKNNSDKPEWVYKAIGPVWLLRNKSTGKTRVLQKVAPLGKAGMNFNLMKSAAMYAQQNKRVTASFIDHINEKEPKKPSQWFVQVGKEEDAKELARLMKEEAEKQ